MRIEMDETSALTIWACIATIALLVGALGGCYQCEATNREAIKSGLVQKPAQAANCWVKPE